YLSAKFAAFATVVAAIYIVPQLILHIGLGLIARDGFIAYMGDNLDILWKVPVVTLGFVLLHGALIFLLSAIIKRPGIASVAFLAVITAASGIAGQVSRQDFPGARWLALLNLDQHPRVIRDKLFDQTTQLPAQLAGFNVWASVIVIIAVCLI